jgi:hypothetical protein
MDSFEFHEETKKKLTLTVILTQTKKNANWLVAPNYMELRSARLQRRSSKFRSWYHRRLDPPHDDPLSRRASALLPPSLAIATRARATASHRARTTRRHPPHRARPGSPRDAVIRSQSTQPFRPFLPPGHAPTRIGITPSASG